MPVRGRRVRRGEGEGLPRISPRALNPREVSRRTRRQIEESPLVSSSEKESSEELEIPSRRKQALQAGREKRLRKDETGEKEGRFSLGEERRREGTRRIEEERRGREETRPEERRRTEERRAEEHRPEEESSDEEYVPSESEVSEGEEIKSPSATKDQARTMLEFLSVSTRRGDQLRENLDTVALMNFLSDIIHGTLDPRLSFHFSKFMDIFKLNYTSRTFASLSNNSSDKELLSLRHEKAIHFSDDLTSVSASTSFNEMLQDIQSYLNMSTLESVRILSNIHLLEAIKGSSEPLLSIYPQYETSMTLERDRKVFGKVDFVIAKPLDTTFSEERHRRTLQRGISVPGDPFFALVTAPPGERLFAFEMQMAAILLCFTKQSRSHANGVLTNGDKVSFYRMEDNYLDTLFISKEYSLQYERGLILAILRSWVCGKMPTGTVLEK